MIIDSSALIAILFREPGFEALLERLAAAESVGIGAPTLAESGIVATARLKKEARLLIMRFIEEAGIEVIPFGETHAQVALDAYVRYGRGRHKASLNFGDCMTYAVAKLADMPLLYVAQDFTKTDITS